VPLAHIEIARIRGEGERRLAQAKVLAVHAVLAGKRGRHYGRSGRAISQAI
jgi:hypothetical protein